MMPSSNKKICSFSKKWKCVIKIFIVFSTLSDITDFLVTHCPEQVLRQSVLRSAAFSYILVFCVDSHRCNKDDFHESYVRLIPLSLLTTLTIGTKRRLRFFFLK